ncbi:MAG: DUF4339 domain-containing protein [Proteobacteria bacterium]|nr:DUF4339 domain-containing protein [Pseudomonadota bacterium]
MMGDSEATVGALCPHCGAPAAVGAAPPGPGGAGRLTCVACGEAFDAGAPQAEALSWLARRGARHWFVAQGERRIGPLTAQEVREAIGQGELTTRCCLWRPGLVSWASLRDLEEFADLGGQSAAGAPAEIEGEKTRVWHEGEQQHLISLVAEAEPRPDPGDGRTEERSLAGIFGEVDATPHSVVFTGPGAGGGVDDLGLSARGTEEAPIAAPVAAEVPLTAARHDSSVLFSLDEQAQRLALAVTPEVHQAAPYAPAVTGPRVEEPSLATTHAWASFAPHELRPHRVPGSGHRRGRAIVPVVLVLALAAGLFFYATRDRETTGMAPVGLAVPSPLGDRAPLPSPALLARPGPIVADAGRSPGVASGATVSPDGGQGRAAKQEDRARLRAIAPGAGAGPERSRLRIAVATARHGRPWPAAGVRSLPATEGKRRRQPPVQRRAQPPAARAPASVADARPPIVGAAAARSDQRPLSTQQIVRGLEAAQAAVQRCSRRHVQPAVVTVALLIDGRTGRVGAGRVLSIFAGTAVGVCALAAVREDARFPTFSGPPLKLTWPILLR